MLFSVIIPTCNRNDLLAKCLTKLESDIQLLGKDDYELIVTDDGHNKAAKGLIEGGFQWVNWVEGPKRGRGANRNNGAKKALGKWLVFIDDDCLPDAALLINYQKAINTYNHILAFEGSIYPDNWKELEKDMAECPVNVDGGVFWSANICVDANLFKAINGFDEQYVFYGHEDQDLYQRILLKTPVQFVKLAKVIHPVRITSLLDKIRDLPPSIKSWYIYEYKQSTFLQCVKKGFKSQFFAFLHGMKSFKIRKTTLHLITLIVFFPIMLSIKNLNEKQARF